MLKFHKTPTCFGPHLQRVRQALLKLPLCTINMYTYVGDVGDGPMGTETCRSFMKF